jgi:hypothetical protein
MARAAERLTALLHERAAGRQVIRRGARPAAPLPEVEQELGERVISMLDRLSKPEAADENQSPHLDHPQ